MEVFDNCRICLREINHEPIKMTRLILKFLEKSLQLPNVTKPNTQENVKQNLCAACFNKISEFQDFYEQCKDSDEFWKVQFADFKPIVPEKQLRFEQTVLLPLTDDSSSLEADTTVPTTEEENPQQTTQQAILQFNEDEITRLGEDEAHIIISASRSPIKEIDDDNQIENFNQSIDLTNWSDDINNDKESDIQIVEEGVQSVVTKTVTEELIEYEYQIDEIEEDVTVVEENVSSESLDVDYRSFDYEKIETEASNESTNIHQTIEDSMEEQNESTTTSQNSFFMTTTIDETGKVKMSYKCQHCGRLTFKSDLLNIALFVVQCISTIYR